MKIINENISLKTYSSANYDFYFNGLKLGIWDIETTGLNPSNSSLILSGVIDVNGEYSTVTQYLAESQNEEIEIIYKTLVHLRTFDYILTYNGRHFDMNFLIKRCEKFDIDCSRLPYILDLYLILNGHSSLREFLPNLKQGTIERFMGIGNDRKDEISGKEHVELYLNYEKSHNTQLEKLILLHNHDDVIQLYSLLDVLKKCDLEKAMYKLGFPLDRKNYIASITIKNSKLTVLGIQRYPTKNYSFFGDENRNYSYNINAYTGNFTIEIPLIKEKGASFVDLIDLKVDTQSLKKYSNFINNYLIITNKNEINYLETIHLIKLIFQEILTN